MKPFPSYKGIIFDISSSLAATFELIHRISLYLVEVSESLDEVITRVGGPPGADRLGELY